MVIILKYFNFVLIVVRVFFSKGVGEWGNVPPPPLEYKTFILLLIYIAGKLSDFRG